MDGARRFPTIDVCVNNIIAAPVQTPLLTVKTRAGFAPFLHPEPGRGYRCWCNIYITEDPQAQATEMRKINCGAAVLVVYTTEWLRNPAATMSSRISDCALIVGVIDASDCLLADAPCLYNACLKRTVHITVCPTYHKSKLGNTCFFLLFFSTIVLSGPVLPRKKEARGKKCLFFLEYGAVLVPKAGSENGHFPIT